MNSIQPSSGYSVDLPKDIVLEIASYLNPADVRAFGSVSKRILGFLQDHEAFLSQSGQKRILRALSDRCYSVLHSRDYSATKKSLWPFHLNEIDPGVCIKYGPEKYLVMDTEKKIYAWSNKYVDCGLAGWKEIPSDKMVRLFFGSSEFFTPEVCEKAKPLPFAVKETNHVQKLRNLLLVASDSGLSIYDPEKMRLIATYGSFDRVIAVKIIDSVEKSKGVERPSLKIQVTCEIGTEFHTENHKLREFILDIGNEHSATHLEDRICDYRISKWAYRFFQRSGIELSNFRKEYWLAVKKVSGDLAENITRDSIGPTAFRILQYPTLFMFPSVLIIHHRFWFYRNREGTLRSYSL